jgi:isoleucyl-tRNA synthetase
VKSIELLDDASGILIKQIKPNFKSLGPRFGKEINQVATAVKNFTQEQINQIENEKSITLDIGGNSINLSVDDVEITSQDIPGWLVAKEGNITVALDITLTESLIKEGIARELVNRIQNMRKDSGFEVTDKIFVYFEKDALLEAAINDNKDYIMSETLSRIIDFKDVLENGTPLEVDGIQTRIVISK